MDADKVINGVKFKKLTSDTLQCECGQQLKDNEGGLTKHLKSKGHKKKMKSIDEVKDGGDIQHWFKKAAIKKANKNRNDDADDIKISADNDININGDINNSDDINNDDVDGEINEQMVQIQDVQARVDANGGLLIESSKKIEHRRCDGFIPKCLSEIDPNKLLLYLPIDRNDIDRYYFATENGLHHIKCPLILYDEYEDEGNDRRVNKMCHNLIDDADINRIVIIANPIRESKLLHTHNDMLSYDARSRKGDTKQIKLRKLRSEKQWLTRKIVNNACKITLFTRIMTETAKSNKDGISNIFRMYAHSGKSEKWILNKIELYVNGLIEYHPHKSHEEKLRSILILLLSGPKLLDSLYNSGILVSTKLARIELNKMISENIINDKDGITKTGLIARIDEIIKPFMHETVIGVGTFAVDEIHINKKMEISLKTREILGGCTCHRQELHIHIISDENDAKSLIKDIQNGDMMMAQLVCVWVLVLHRPNADD